MTTLRLIQATLATTLLATSTLLSGCVIHIDQDAVDAEVTLQEDISIAINNIDTLAVDTGAGSLKIYGQENLDEIKASAQIITSEDLDYTFTLVKQGNTAKFVAKDDASSGIYWGKSPRINVVLYVPKALMLDVEDSSGDVMITDFNNDLLLEDSSGDIVIRNIHGNVDIDDRSGNITITAVEGSLRVDDSSGDIDISGTKGNVVVDDNSGGIYIQDTAGNINVEDNSGDIKIFNTQGIVNIDDGSGDISVERAYSLNIIDDGSGGTYIKDVSSINNKNH